MKAPEDLTSRARTNYRRNVRDWLGGEFTELVFSLSPPTVREAEADNGEAVQAWLQQWRSWTGPGRIEYTTKRLGYLGRYELPSRITLSGPEEVARAAGQLKDWRQVSSRLRDLVDQLGEEARVPLLGQFQRWRDWDDATAARFVAVVDWLRSHDSAGYYVREIPVIGVDGKWIETHRAVIQAVAGKLSFRAKPPLVDLRSLDPGVTIRGARRICLEVTDAAASDPAFRQVLIVENHTTFLALPDLPGTVAVWGSGYRADDLVAALPWLAERRVIYWGDLDSHGFLILDRVRARLPQVRSVLMDTGTARMHVALAVEEPTATVFRPARLTVQEEATLELLRERSGTGCLRIEQERIAFDWASRQLRRAVGA